MGFIPSKRLSDSYGFTPSNIVRDIVDKKSSDLIQTNEESTTPAFWSELLPASFRLGNSIYSAYEKMNNYADAAFQEKIAPVEGYSAFDDPDELKGYEDEANSFVLSDSPEQTRYIKSSIDKQRRDRETIAKASGVQSFVSGMAAGIVDPIFLAGAAVTGGVINPGTSMLLKGVAEGVSAASGSALQEAVLQLSQETRTLEESALNIGAAAFLGGVLGAAGAGVSKAFKSRFGNGKAVAKGVESDLTIPKSGDYIGGERITIAPEDIKLLETEGKSLSAAFAKKIESEIKIKPAMFLEKMQHSPSLRTITSISGKTREASELLADNGLFKTSNIEGVITPDSAEAISSSLLRETTYDISTANRNIFREYRSSKPENKMSFAEFKDQTALAMIENDMHPNTYVQRAAQENRKIVNKIYKLAVDVGLLPANIERKTAPSYFTRVWNRKAIQARREDFTRTIADYYKTEYSLTVDDAKDAALKTVTSILGSDGRVNYSNVYATPRGSLKALKLNIPDITVRDFLITDVEKVMRRYADSIIPDVAIRKNFPKDTINLDGKLTEISHEYDQMILKISDKDPKAFAKRKELQAMKERDMSDIVAMRDIIRGTYQINSSNVLNKGRELTRVAKTLNSTLLLGSVALSNVIDVCGVVFRDGFMKTFGDLFVPFIRNIHKSLARIEIKGKTQAYKGIKELGYGNDVKASIDLLLGSINKDFNSVSPSLYDDINWFQKGLSNTSKVSQLVNLGAYVNDKIKSMAAYTAMADILRSAKNVRVSDRSLSYLGMAGVPEEIVNRISKNAITKSDIMFLENFKPNESFKSNINSIDIKETFSLNKIGDSESISINKDFINRIKESKGIKAKQSEKLARFGLGEIELETIRKEFIKHGGYENGYYYADMEKWTNETAKDLMRNSIYRMTRASSIEYGLEIPNFLHTAWGGVFGQYKQFLFAAMQRYMMVSAQQRDLQSVMGMASMVALGTISGYLGLKLSGKDTDKSPEEWLEMGIDRSGVMGLLFDAEQIAKVASDGRIAFNMFGKNDKKEYYRQGSGLAQFALGPTASVISNIGKTIGAGIDVVRGKDLKGHQISAIRRSIPLQNSILIGKLFNAGEDALRVKYGISRKFK